jgi:hypothetical protein
MLHAYIEKFDMISEKRKYFRLAREVNKAVHQLALSSVQTKLDMMCRTREGFFD